MTKPTRITLANASDTWNFKRGMPLKMTNGGQLVPMTRTERLLSRIAERWHRCTRWFRSRTVVADIDARRGVLTMATERWSWRQWKWVRQ